MGINALTLLSLLSGASSGAIAAATGADLLLDGETDGMASDFTSADGLGQVSVKDTSTPGNVVSNVSADAWWGNAGTSPKLVSGSDGVLKWSPHNTTLQSQTIDNASWFKTRSSISANAIAAPDGTLTADKIVEDGTATSTHFASQVSVATTTGAITTFSVRAKAGERTWLDLASGVVNGMAWFDLANGVVGTVGAAATASMIALGNGWYLCSVTVVATGTDTTFQLILASADNTISYSGDNASGLYLWGAQSNLGPIATAYLATTTAARFGLGIDYANGSYGLLVEPAATNLALRSQEFGTTWAPQASATVTADQAVAPDGTTTADRYNESASAASDFIQQGIVVAANTNYTFSIYVKRVTTDWFRLINFDANSPTNRVSGWFNLGTGAVGSFTNGGTGTGASGTITALGNSWYRITLTGTPNNSATTVNVAFSSADADASTARVNSSQFYVWGAQLELGTVATSPIPTFAATVTRAADNVSKALTALPFSATNGSLLFEGTFQQATAVSDGVSPRIVAIDDGTTAEEIRLVRVATTNLGNIGVTDGGVTGASVSGGVMAGKPTLNKLAGSWAANDVECAVNGTLSGAADTTVTLPTVTTMRLGVDSSPAGRFPGHIKKLIYLPRTWSDAELQAKSAP